MSEMTLDHLLKPHREAAEAEYPEVIDYYATEEYERAAFAAGARHALTHPIILTSVEELEALPVGAKVLGFTDTVWTATRSAAGTLMVEADGGWRTPGALVKSGPLQLISLPAETEEDA